MDIVGAKAKEGIDVRLSSDKIVLGLVVHIGIHFISVFGTVGQALGNSMTTVRALRIGKDGLDKVLDDSPSGEEDKA